MFKELIDIFGNHEPAVIDSTAISKFKQCDRLYFYSIVLGRAPKRDNNEVVLQFGIKYHKFRELLEEKGEDAALIWAASVNLPKTTTAWSKFKYLTEERFIQTCASAIKWVREEKSAGRIEVIATEQPFNIQMPDGTFTGGRVDQLVRWNGKLYIRDFKTTSKDKVYFGRGFSPHDQVTRYIYSLNKLSEESIKGVILEAAFNIATKGPTIFAELQERTKDYLSRWESDQILIHEDMKRRRELAQYPMRETRACAFCNFRDVCSKSSVGGIISALKTDFMHKPWDFQHVGESEE